MIIPLSRDTDFKKGDDVILIRQIIEPYAIFCVGHKFKVTGEDGYGYTLIDEDGIKIKERGIDKSYITKVIGYFDAKEQHESYIEMEYIKKYIQQRCPNKTQEISDREYYDGCKLQTNRYIECNPTLNCLKYLEESEIKDEKIKLYLRKLKIKDIKK
jgi:hypothetical protein